MLTSTLDPEPPVVVPDPPVFVPPVNVSPLLSLETGLLEVESYLRPLFFD